MGAREKEIAMETMMFLRIGGYGKHWFNKEVETVKTYSPMRAELLVVKVPEDNPDAKVTLYNQDSCECAGRFVDEGTTCVLNFASAYNPGGGFLNGATAQEEAICRNSTLYTSISSRYAKEYYMYNKACNDELYSDYIIYSPCVEVMRNGASELLEEPYTITVITSPAVNVNTVVQATMDEINEAMLVRAECILKVAIVNHVDNIVLGAWGCGAFGNDPTTVAQIFRRLLFEKGYIKAFKNVSFAIYGRDRTNYKAFKEVFNL